jgi:hypothetical protein
MAISGSGVEKNALANSGTAAGQATNAYNTVNPIYSKLATGTVGYSPTQKANELTASSQSLGGGLAADVGAGGLLAARTGNAGGATAALDDAARNAASTQSSQALDVQNRSNDLATENQRVGLSGLNSIYNDANSTGVGYLNTANSAAQAEANRKMGYIRMGLDAVGAAAGGA